MADYLGPLTEYQQEQAIYGLAGCRTNQRISIDIGATREDVQQFAEWAYADEEMLRTYLADTLGESV